RSPVVLPGDPIGSRDVAGSSWTDGDDPLGREAGRGDHQPPPDDRRVDVVALYALGAPQLTAGRGVVADDELVAVRHELGAAVCLDEDRRGPARLHRSPRPPYLLAGRCIESGNERVVAGILVPLDDEEVLVEQ